MVTEEILVNMWRETRSTLNHFDSMMDQVRIRAFTLFSAITSVAAALYHWAPDTQIKIIGSSIGISAFVELSIILIIIPLYAQNRLYHFWLYRTIQTLIFLENKIYSHIEKEIENKDVMLTYSLTKFDVELGGYWKTMIKSKLFWMDLGIFIFIILMSVIIYLCFNIKINNV